MDIRPKVRNAVLVGALAAVTATAWATNEVLLSDADYAADNSVVIAETPAPDTVVVIDSVAPDSLSPNETVVATPYATQSVTVPVAAPVYEPGIIVEERRLTPDERIQAVVMDRLATSNISGKIGVESYDSVVTLSGWTTTAMQADRAARTARGVTGVRYVQNQIRPRIGGSAS